MPESINRFQQLNSATISGVYSPAVSQNQVLDFMRKAVAEVAPSGYQVDYSGQSRQFVQESGGFVVTLLFAVIIVFLALAAQFESFRDPIVILVSVPLALFGAMIFIILGLATLNIYTQVGLVTLMGLISKHGILIVQFANELQRPGKTKREAIEHAAAHPSAADPDDHRRDGPRRGAAGHRLRCRCRRTPRHGPGDLHRAVDRHAVHLVRRAGDVHADRCRPPPQARRRRAAGACSRHNLMHRSTRPAAAFASAVRVATVCGLLQLRLAHEVVAIGGVNLHVHDLAVAHECKRHVDACGTDAPGLAQQVGQVGRAFSADFEHNVA